MCFRPSQVNRQENTNALEKSKRPDTPASRHPNTPKAKTTAKRTEGAERSTPKIAYGCMRQKAQSQ